MNNQSFGSEVLPYITITDFTDSSLVAFKESFFKLEQSEIPIITIYISSFGGDIYAMDSMRDLIQSSNKPVATVALGKAMSAGLFLLAAGTKGYRFAAPNASLMFHEVRGGGPGKASEFAVEAREMEKMHQRLIKNFAKDTDHTPEFWHEKNDKNKTHDLYLTAEEGKELGIVDWVYLPRIGVHPHQYFLTMPEEFNPEEQKETMNYTGDVGGFEALLKEQEVRLKTKKTKVKTKKRK